MKSESFNLNVIARGEENWWKC